MTSIDDIISAVQSLPSEDRAKLIPLLWDKLNPEDWPMPFGSWIEESKQRSDQLDNGEMNADSWQNVRDRARKKAGLDG